MGLVQERDSADAPAGMGRRRAVLICNGSFPNWESSPILAGPAKDAIRLEAVLTDAETGRFDVCTLVDKGLIEVRREIARICADALAEDTLLIYYSGVGRKRSDGSLYLLVADSDGKYPFATALDADFVLAHLCDAKCRRKIVMIDSNFAGAFFARNRGVPDGFYALTSCGADDWGRDSSEGGPFTLAVCEGLRDVATDTDGDGMVTLDELYEYAAAKLRATGLDTSGLPQKWMWNVREKIAIMDAPWRVFLSYAREDMVEVDRLAAALTSQGLPVWLDREGIRSGDQWKKSVTNGLSRARAVVLLLTENSLASDAVRKELDFATKKKVPIIPVQLEEIPEAAMPDWYTFDYNDLQRQLIQPSKYHEGVEKLVTEIRGKRTDAGRLPAPKTTGRTH